MINHIKNSVVNSPWKYPIVQFLLHFFNFSFLSEVPGRSPNLSSWCNFPFFPNIYLKLAIWGTNCFLLAGAWYRKWSRPTGYGCFSLGLPSRECVLYTCTCKCDKEVSTLANFFTKATWTMPDIENIFNEVGWVYFAGIYSSCKCFFAVPVLRLENLQY